MVMPGTGELEQLVPTEEQIVDGEPQVPTRPSSPLVTIEEPEKRTIPPPAAPRPPLPSPAAAVEQSTQLELYGLPVVKWDRWIGTDQEWRVLVRWDIPVGFYGDLHEISLQSSNDEKTRWRIVLGNVDQDIPTDRQLSTPVTMPWRRTVLPGGSSVWIETHSTDGTAINVDGLITGSVR